MTVLVSACLLGENCKYNGWNNASPAILEFLKDKQVIPICPELLAGMPSPRPPVEIKDARVIRKNGEDVTDAFDFYRRSGDRKSTRLNSSHT